VQGVVNPFGTNAIAAFNSVTRVDSFMLAPGDSFASSMGTYSAQNMGAGKRNRIVEGYKNANIIITVYSIITSLVVFLGAEMIMRFFVSGNEIEVILIGVKYLRFMSVFYIISGFCNILQGLFRGVGKLRITLIATLMQISIRVVLSFLLAPYFGISAVGYAVAAGWIMMLIYEGLACKRFFYESKELAQESA
jgi:Na+-driven multidrug efflux pump